MARSLSQRTRRRILKRDDFTCQYCGWSPPDSATTWAEMSNLHVDHMIPVSRGGGDDEENLVTACWACNLQKGNRLWWIPKAQCCDCGQWFYDPPAETVSTDWHAPLFMCPHCSRELDERLMARAQAVTIVPVSEIAIELAEWDRLIAAGWDVR